MTIIAGIDAATYNPWTQHISEAWLRLSFFLGLWSIFAIAEALWPRQRGRAQRSRRWPANFGMAVVDTLAVRLLLPWAAVAASVWAQAHHVGLLSVLPLSSVAAWTVTLLTLDLVIYVAKRLLITQMSQPVIRAGRSVQPSDPARVAPWPRTKSSFSPA